MPNGAEEKFRWGDRREPSFLFLQGKVGYRVAPSSAPVCALGHLPPKGKALGVGMILPVCETTRPSPPSWGAGRYGRGMQGRRPVSEHRKNLPLATNQREVGPGRREPLSALVFFPPTFSKESRAPPPESAGNPRCRVHPATVPTEPPTDDRGPPPGAGRATGRCAPRPRKSPDHGKGPYPGAGPLLRP